MKMTKKKVFVIALAVCLVAIISMSSLAWFSDSKQVQNDFFIADTDDDTADDIFSIDLWENTPVDDLDRDGYEYEDILPGDSLRKDIWVMNTGYYDQYVRVIITISDRAAWLNALNDVIGSANADQAAAQMIFNGLDLSKWGAIYNNMIDEPNSDELVYVLYYNSILEASQAINVFKSIEIPTSMTREEAALFDNQFTITVKAQAVQTENVVPATITEGKNAAWEAFKTVGLQ